jgi:hypothetical protein
MKTQRLPKKKKALFGVIAVLLFIVWCFWLTNFLYARLTPKTDTLVISRENKHQILARNGPLYIETSGGNIVPNQDETNKTQAEITNFLNEISDANSFPFFAKWMLKFDVSIALKNVKIENSNIQVSAGVACNNISSPNSIIYSKQGIYLQDFLAELKTSLPEILNGCSVSLTGKNGTTLPDVYISKESYSIDIKPVLINNFFAILIVVILGSFALLPVLREGIRFFTEGFDYFINKKSEDLGSNTN